MMIHRWYIIAIRLTAILGSGYIIGSSYGVFAGIVASCVVYELVPQL